MSIYQIFIHFIAGLLMCLTLYLISVLTTNRPRLFRNALYWGIMITGFQSIGYLRPSIIPYSNVVSPDTLGKLGMSVMFFMIFWSYYRQSNHTPNGKAIRRKAIKEMSVGLVGVLTISMLAAIVESNQIVAEKEQKRAETNKDLVKEIRAIQAFNLIIWREITDLRDGQEKFKAEVLNNQKTALERLEKDVPSKPRRKPVSLKGLSIDAVEPKRVNFDVMPGRLPEIYIEPKPRKFKGNRRTGYVPFDCSTPRDSAVMASIIQFRKPL